MDDMCTNRRVCEDMLTCIDSMIANLYVELVL